MSTIRSISAAGILLSVLAGAFLGVAGTTARFAEATSYLSDDPRACVNCHVMRDHYDAWAKGPHHAVAGCNDCHVPQDLVGKYLTKAAHGWRHSRAFTMQDFHEPIMIRPADLEIVENNCVRCHQGLTEHMAFAPTSSGAGAISCTHCHTAAGHGPQR